MKYLSKEHYTTVLDPRLKPAVTIGSGEELVVQTWDAFMGAWEAPEVGHPVGPATGPIGVEGARPGDALRVDILSIDVADECVHVVRPHAGFLPEMFAELRPTVMEIREGQIIFPGGIKLPLRPSVGLIAVTPRQARQTASDSGAYGGDLDLKELTAGSSVWLPVLVEGGLLVLGDCHALVGDGAVGGTGAEVAAEVRVRVTVEKGAGIKSPRVLTQDHFVTIAYGSRLGPAMKRAVRSMVEFLASERGMKSEDAYALLSLAGDIRISRTLRPISPVKMMLSRSALEQVGGR